MFSFSTDPTFFQASEFLSGYQYSKELGNSEFPLDGIRKNHSVLHDGGADSFALLSILVKRDMRPSVIMVDWEEKKNDESWRLVQDHAVLLGLRSRIIEASYLDTIFSLDFLEFCCDYRVSDVERAALAYVGDEAVLGGFPSFEKTQRSDGISWDLVISNHDFANSKFVPNFSLLNPGFAISVAKTPTAKGIVSGSIPGKISFRTSKIKIYEDLGLNMSHVVRTSYPDPFFWENMQIKTEVEHRIGRRLRCTVPY